jgi:alpha-L-rhamnosidase
MTAYYLFKQLYALDRPQLDLHILNLLRGKFRAMVDSPMQCSWESYGGGSKAHIYGMYPGYFLSAYVLGVRRDRPVADQELLIEPHLGDLTEAAGTVVTEFGPVSVSWSRKDGKLIAEVVTPAGTSATLALPVINGRKSPQMDGRKTQGRVRGERLCIEIKPGKHAISY